VLGHRVEQWDQARADIPLNLSAATQISAMAVNERRAPSPRFNL
jgi:hypothetical protein